MDIHVRLYRNASESYRVDKYITLLSTVSGTLQPPSSLLHPTILVKVAGSMPTFNYVYIEEFARYYYAQSPVWVSGQVWSVALDVDSLMSHKSALRALSAFIERNENDYDDTITDNSVGTTGGKTVTQYDMNRIQSLSMNWEGGISQLSNSGGLRVIVGIACTYYNKSVLPNGPVLYVAMNWRDYVTFMNNIRIFTNSALSKYINVLTDFIVEAYVLPYQPVIGSTRVTSVSVLSGLFPDDTDPTFNLPDSVYAYALTDFNDLNFAWSLELSDKLNATPYRRTAPYTTATFESFPLGSIELDMTPTVGLTSPKLYVYARGNFITGALSYWYGFSNTVPSTIPELKNICRIPLGQTYVKSSLQYINGGPITQSSIIHTITGTASGFKDAIGSGGALGAAMAGANLGEDIANATFMYSGSTSMGGNVDNLIVTSPKMVISTVQQLPIPADLMGRPLYRVRPLSEVTGFTVVGDIHTDGLTCTEEERRDIEALMTSGVIL